MIATMEKVQIAVPSAIQDELLTWLQDEEVVHVTPLAAEREAAASDTAHQLAQLQFALEFLLRMRSELNHPKQRSWQRMFATKPIASLQEMQVALTGFDVAAELEKIQETSDTISTLTAQEQTLKERGELLTPWRDLRLEERQQPGRDRVRHILLTLTLAEEDRLLSYLQDIPTATWQEVNRVVEKKQGTMYWEVVVHTSDSEAMEMALTETNAAEVNLDLPVGMTPQREMVLLKQQMEELTRKRTQLLEEAAGLLAAEEKLQMAYDALLHKQEREKVEVQARRGAFIFMVEGWVPAAKVHELRNRLEETLGAAALETLPAAAAEKVPVLFENARWARPFEAVTDIYGKPKYTELDPSPFLALFFLVSFGLALTDAGYGLVMMATMATSERLLKLKRSMRKMVRLLFYAGGMTVILGALTGGWFGVQLETLPDSGIKSLFLAMKVIDPVAQPITLLLVAFAIGIVQLLFAWVIKAYDLWRKGERMAAVYDGALWITMVATILAWAGAGRGILSAQIQPVLGWIVLANAALLVATQGRHNKNIFVRAGSGVLSLYGLINFLSDVLSYSRLLALGLATGIIGLVVNLIAGMVAGMIPVVGVGLAAIVLLGGHVFNLGINALGAFIHSGRLQFVEFFPKFMEGGGLAYKPLGRVGKYIDNPREFA